ncbi:MAG: sulfite exporter TauE/SafE family protein [Bdellovibrionales bacterium]|nr:sulfite exporter TauE/SafE family protein [Bdellovibrionales bacterium]
MHLSLFLISALVASLGTIAGFGGGVFLVPIMVMAFQVPISHAIGVTALSLFPASLLSTLVNLKNKNIDFKLMLALELPTLLGAVLGARLTSLVPTKPLEFVFAGFLIFLSWRLFRPRLNSGHVSQTIRKLNSFEPALRSASYRVSFFAATLFGLLAGVLAGLFGIGGGILKTPIMLQVFNVPVRIATGTALCMIVFTSLGSGLTHWQLGHVTPSLLLPCASGFLAGALFGQLLGIRLTDNAITKTVGFSIALAGAAVLVHAALAL